MTNAELVAVAVGKWLTPIVKTIGGGIKIPKVVNSYLDAAISKATAKGSVNLFGFEFEATAFQNLKREIDNSLKNNVSHDERPA